MALRILAALAAAVVMGGCGDGGGTAADAEIEGLIAEVETLQGEILAATEALAAAAAARGAAGLRSVEEMDVPPPAETLERIRNHRAAQRRAWAERVEAQRAANERTLRNLREAVERNTWADHWPFEVANGMTPRGVVRMVRNSLEADLARLEGLAPREVEDTVPR